MNGIFEAVEQEETICGDVETVRESTYLGDRMTADGGSWAVVTARTRCGWLSLGSAVSCCTAGDFL